MSTSSHVPLPQGPFLDPLSPIGVKLLLGRPSGRALLLDFLGALRPGHRPAAIRYGPQRGPGFSFESAAGRRYRLEVHLHKRTRFRDHVMEELSRMLCRGYAGRAADACYIGLLNFPYRRGRQGSCIHRFRLREAGWGPAFSRRAQVILVEMPRFRKKPEALLSRLDHWLYVLKHMGGMDEMPAWLRQPPFPQLFRAAAVPEASRADLRRYIDELSAYCAARGAEEEEAGAGRPPRVEDAGTTMPREIALLLRGPSYPCPRRLALPA